MDGRSLKPGVDYLYQNVGFHFRVVFSGLGVNRDSFDSRFQSVTGLDVQMDTETIKEGGENKFEHVVPTRRKYSDLVLKRGLLSPSAGSELTIWFKDALDFKGDFIDSNGFMRVYPIDLEVHLLNENHDPIMKWVVIHAWPKNWKLGELNAERSEVLIETLELNYNRFEFIEP